MLLVETGAYRGYTSGLIGLALQQNGHGRLVAIEQELRQFRLLRKRCRQLPVEPVHGSSLDWVPPNNERIEFAFFDTNFETRVHEFGHYWPYMNEYTVICWHDSGLHHGRKAIRPGIENLANGGIIQPLYLPTPRGVCFARLLRTHNAS